MKFRNITIPAEGRNKYGNYVSSTELQKSVVRVTYNGNNTTGGNQPNKPVVEPEDVYTLFLSRSTIKFDSKKLLDGNITESIDVLGFVNSRSGDTFIGILDNMPEQDDVLFNNTYYDIVGLAEKGMTVSVSDNGTPTTKINITCTKDAIDNEVRGGTLVIPCSVYKKSGDVSLGPYLDDWASEKENCHTLYLEVQWEISVLPASNAYTLELTNEIAGINCDSEGKIYANAVRPTCQAIMYYGAEEVEGETYSISIDEDRNAQGVTINTTTGELTFGSNFTFDGTTLEVKVTGNANGALQSKIMTIVKQYAGAKGENGEDGAAAVTRWVVPSVNVIKFNPNTNTLTPNKISCKVMKQEGENAPVEDTATKIYYGYDTTNPITQYNSEISIDASKGYIAFALKNASNVIYEIETIQIIKEGQNGQNGKDGSNGSNGQSVYRLALTNENASINADADGNIYANAHRPTCTATLYLGATKVSNATYSITTNPTATGVSINSTTGVITFANNFTFTGTSLEITVTAMVGGIIYGTSIMTVSKSMAGKDGADGQNGTNGADGVNGQDGKDGKDGTSIVWKGEFASHPSNPQNGWAYKNTTDKKSYIYQDNAWYQMTIDGTDGQDGKDGKDGNNGTDGLSIVWKGESASAPSNPKTNWCYKDTDNGKVYIYNGSAWELMVLDGSDGEDGADGADGLSVYITYHDNAITSTPANPTGNGTTGGWHTNATKAANWMSQKVASAATAGTWGAPIQICGANGQDGQDGEDGKDGTNGADAVSYWLDLSTTEVVVAKGATTATPSSVTLKAYKQIGGNAPTEITSTGVIKWGYNTSSPQSTATTISNISIAQTYIMVHLVVDGVIYDRQTISILKDGKDGTNGKDGTDGKDGAQGRQGAALRGPVDWKNQTTSRRWCNGTLTNASYPEDAEFIDIVVYNGTYYKCKTSYNGKGSETTAPSTTYWTATDKQYEFVSTNLLLADNAKIKFATNNELYLTDSNGNVTAGAAGGNGVSFWAGANEPTNAKFKVNYEGEMEATKGKFGILQIGVDSWNDGRVFGSDTQSDGAISEVSIQPQIIEMQALYNGTIRSNIRIAPYPDPDKYDMDGEICVNVTDSRTHLNGFFTNACVEAGSGFRSRVNYCDVFTPFSSVNNMVITFITDTNLFTKSNGDWYFNGLPIAEKISAGTYPYMKVINGEWTACSSSSATSGWGTGIYSTAHTKQNNRLYIQL